MLMFLPIDKSSENGIFKLFRIFLTMKKISFLAMLKIKKLIVKLTRSSNKKSTDFIKNNKKKIKNLPLILINRCSRKKKKKNNFINFH
jgi:hypothetical protein